LKHGDSAEFESYEGVSKSFRTESITN